MTLSNYDLLQSKGILDICRNTVADEEAINEWVQSQSQDLFFDAPTHMKQTWGVNYNLFNKLGTGQFGSVYRIEDTKVTQTDSLDRVKVIKFISIIDIMLDETIDAVKEARVLSKLNCPYIITFYDSFIEDSMFCIVTEYCEGGDLAMFIKRKQQSQKKIDTATVLDWFVQLTIALKYIHQRKIIHRDLKTRNVFLRRNRVKLGDFGISRMMKSYNEYANTFAGTPYYMSPEVLKQEGYNFKSDIWSLGCIFYELLMLDRPYTGRSIMALLYRIVEEEPPQLPDNFSFEIRNLSKKMLEKDPKLRPTAHEILQMSFFRTHIESMRGKSLLQRNISYYTTDNVKKPYLFTQLSSPANLSFEESKINQATPGVFTFTTVDTDPIPHILTPKERMLSRKRERADGDAIERRELAQAQFKENVRLFENEKRKSTTNPTWLSSPKNTFDNNYFPSYLLNQSTSYTNNVDTLTLDPTNPDTDMSTLNATSPYIPDDPVLAETHYLQDEDFEEYSENEMDCISSDAEEHINSEDEYECMLYYLENALRDDCEMSYEEENLLSLSQQTVTLENRVRMLRNECLSTLGAELFNDVYKFLKVARFGLDVNGNGRMEDEGLVQMQLSKVTDNRNGCFLVDQLVFFERQIF